MKKLLIGVFWGFLFLPFLYVPALGDNEESVEAQVTVEEVSVLVTGTFPIDYGVLGYGHESGEKGPFTVRNSGSVIEDISFMGEDAVNANASSWDLREVPALDAYAHLYELNDGGVFTYFREQEDGGYVTVVTDLNPNIDFTTKTKLKTPSTSTDTGTYTTKIWVRATASL